MKLYTTLTVMALLTTSCARESGPAEMEDVVLVEGGTSEYTITVSRGAPAPIQFAAEELQRYLSEISSAKLPITARPLGASIRVGLDEGSSLHESLQALPEDSFLIQAEKGTLYLGGNSPRGTLFFSLLFFGEVS